MNYKLSVSFLALLLLSACATAPLEQSTKPADDKQQQEPLSLESMDAQFLYLASQQARDQGQDVLAARFLKALIKKDTEAVAPRLELVELYMASGQLKQIKEAKQIIESIPPASSQALDAESQRQYQLLYAQVLMANNEQEQSLLMLQKLLKSSPDDNKVRMLLVRLYAAGGNYEAAHQLLQQGIKIRPDTFLYQAQVQLYLQQGKLNKADQVLKGMQKRNPDHEEIALQRSQIAESNGDMIKAEELLKLYIDLHADGAVQANYALAKLYIRQNRLPEAVVLYQRVLQLNDDSVSVYMSLGKVYYQMAKYNDAVQVFEKAVGLFLSQQPAADLSDAQSEAVFYLAASLEAAHQWKEAIPYYQRVGKKNPFYLDAQLRLVSIGLAKQDYQAAEEHLAKLQAEFPRKIEVFEMLSSLRVQQKSYKALITETEEALDLGSSEVLLFNRAVAFEALKQYEQLDKTLDQLLAAEPDHSEALNFYGYSLADRNIRLDEAEKMVAKALKLRPDDGYYLDSMAWVYYKQKRFEKAVGIQLQAVEKVKDDPVMFEHLGDIYWRAGKKDKARLSWQKSIDLKHDSPDKMKLKIEYGLSDEI